VRRQRQTPMRLLVYVLLSPLLAAAFVFAVLGLVVRGCMSSFGIGYSAPESVRLRTLRRVWRESGKDYSNN